MIWMTGFLSDVRHGWRTWRRMPAAALTMVILPALGIGGVAAIFSPLYSLVLAPLPFPRSDNLVRIGGDLPIFNLHSSVFEERNRLASVFENVMAYEPLDVGRPIQARLSSAGQPKDVVVHAVTQEFFDTMGVPPRLGTGFADEAASAAVVVLSNRVWRTELQGTPDVIGRSVQLFDHPFTVVGVMPMGFDFPGATDLWVPMGTVGANGSRVQFVGRLRAGMPLEQAALALNAMGSRREQGPTGRVGKDGPVLQPLQVFLRGDRRPMLWVLWAASILFLLLVAAGSANVLLAQGVGRRPEMYVRLALGGGRRRLVRQLLTETLLVVGVGGVLGTWLSIAASQWLQSHLPELRDGRIFAPATVALAVALSLVVTLLCGLAPALRATDMGLASSRKPGTGRPRWAWRRRRVSTSREYLAGAQLALALVLLIAAGLLLRSLTTRISMPLALETHGVVVARVAMPPLPALAAAQADFFQRHGMGLGGSYGPRRHQALMEQMQRTLEPAERAENARNVLFFREAERTLRTLPSVVAVGVLEPAPFTSAATSAMQNPNWVSTRRSGGNRDALVPCIVGRASAQAFEVLGVRLQAGRTFTTSDVAEEFTLQETVQFPPARLGTVLTALSGSAIINQVLARRLWPTESAIGKRFYDRGSAARVVVGVVPHFHQSGYNMTVMPAAYYPFTGLRGATSFLVRLSPEASTERVATEAQRTLAELAPGLVRAEVQSMEGVTAASLTNLRLALVLLSAFSIVGSVVAGLGVYAVAALMAAARAHEFAVRMALGASVTEVRLLAMQRVVRLAAVALPAGLGAGWAVARQLSSLLFQVGTADPTIFVASSALLLAIVLAAGLAPLLRAATANPAAVLRCS